MRALPSECAKCVKMCAIRKTFTRLGIFLVVIFFPWNLQVLISDQVLSVRCRTFDGQNFEVVR